MDSFLGIPTRKVNDYNDDSLFLYHGSKQLTFVDLAEKNLYLTLLEEQKEYQRKLSKLNQNDPLFSEYKKKLSYYGTRLEHYRTRIQPINKQLLNSKLTINIEKEKTENIVVNNNVISSKILYEMCFYTCKEDKDKAMDLYDILTNNFNKYLTEKTILHLTTQANEVIHLRILNINNYTDDELNHIKKNICDHYHNFNLDDVNKKINDLNTIELNRKIKELEIKHEKNLICLKRWEKVRIYFNRLIIIKKFELMKEKIKKAFLNLKALIKKKKNDLLISEKIKTKFDNYHNKIPLKYINTWKYSVAFQNLYLNDCNILNIFKLENNHTLSDLRRIMNIHHFTKSDWIIWSKIVVDGFGEINDLPEHLLVYYKFLDNNRKNKTRDNMKFNTKEMITYKTKIFDEEVELTKNRNCVTCPEKIVDKNRFYDLITKDFFSYDDVVEIITKDEMELRNKEKKLAKLKEEEYKNKEEEINNKYIEKEKIFEENRSKIIKEYEESILKNKKDNKNENQKK